MRIDKKCTIKRIITTIISVLIIGFIFWQSMKPATESSTSSGRVVAFFNNIFSSLGMGAPFTQGFIRTCAHFTEFGMLGSSLCFMFNAYTDKSKVSFILALISSVLIAVCDECIQIFSDGRTFQIIDILIDTAGAFLFSVLTLLLMLLIKRKNRKVK